MAGIRRGRETDGEPLGDDVSERDVRAALVTSETLLRQTLEGTQTGSWYWDIPTNVVSWSDNLGPLHGLPRGTQPSDYAAYLELIHPHDREKIQAAVGAALADGTGYEIELRTGPRDGEVRWIWASATVLPDEQGAPTRVVGLTRDITDRKRELERQTVLAELTPLFERAATPEAALQPLAELLVAHVADWCSIRLVANEDVTGAAVVCSDELRAEVSDEQLRETEESVDVDGTAAGGGTILHRELEASGGIRSAIVAAVSGRDGVVGALAVGAGPSQRRYDEDDRAFVDDLSKAVATEIERARLDLAIEVARREADLAASHAARLQQVTAGLAAAATSAEIADVIIEHGMPALGATTAILGVVEEPGELRFLRLEGYGDVFPERLSLDAPWPVAAAAREQELIELGDVGERRVGYAVPEQVWQESGKGNLVAVPLVARDTVIGALGFTREEPGPLSPGERLLVETLAGQTALALERATLFEADRRARVRAEGLQRVTGAVATAATVEELAGAAATEALEILDASGVTVLLSRPGETDAVEVVASRGDVAAYARDEPAVDLGSATVTAEAIRTQTAVFVEAPEELERAWPRTAQVAEKMGVGAVACVPIRVGDRVGALSVVVSRPRRFPPEERTFLRLLAQACEHGLVRAALYETELEARNRADTLHRLSAGLSRALVPAEVGAVFLEHAVAAFRGVGGSVMLVDARRGSLDAIARSGRGGAESLAVDAPDVESASFRSGEAVVGEPDLDGISVHVRPLAAGGAVIGVASVALADRRGLAPADEQLLSTMTRLCAQALERAHLYESEHVIALRLQRALLPDAVVEHPAARIAARYRAGSESMLVGGDWYDTFALSGERIGIAVGDVVGSGIEAAASMGRLRSALAAFALEGTGPGSVIARLDAFAAGAGGVEFATACYAVVDPATGVVRYASAGHPPLLVVSPSGDARWLREARSPPLAAGLEEHTGDAVDLLVPGSTLLAYSDGLVERRSELIEVGLERLERNALELSELPVDELVNELLARLCADGAGDDVVVVALRLEHVTQPRFRHRFPARPVEIVVCRAALGHWLDRLEVDQVVRNDIVLAVHEACANAVEHAYAGRAPGEVEVDVVAGTAGLVAAISDRGQWRTGPGDPARGQGRRIMEAVAQELSLATSDDGTVVTMVFETVAPVPA